MIDADAVLDLPRLDQQSWAKSEPPLRVMGLLNGALDGWAWQFDRGPVRILASLSTPGDRALLLYTVSHAAGARFLREPERYLSYVREPYRSLMTDYADKVKTAGGAQAKWVAIISEDEKPPPAA